INDTTQVAVSNINQSWTFQNYISVYPIKLHCQVIPLSNYHLTGDIIRSLGLEVSHEKIASKERSDKTMKLAIYSLVLIVSGLTSQICNFAES
ncbi:hypothetical protein ACJX0J_012892, partial [Zea mays]